MQEDLEEAEQQSLPPAGPQTCSPVPVAAFNTAVLQRSPGMAESASSSLLLAGTPPDIAAPLQTAEGAGTARVAGSWGSCLPNSWRGHCNGGLGRDVGLADGNLTHSMKTLIPSMANVGCWAGYGDGQWGSARGQTAQVSSKPSRAGVHGAVTAVVVGV